MIVDGVELLRMIKKNRFEDGDKIIAEITKDQEYIYSAYFRNFLNKNTGKELSVTDYIFWTFIILSEEVEEIDIDSIEEIDLFDNGNSFKDINTVKQSYDRNFENITQSYNELIKAVKQLNRKIKGE